MMNKQNVTVKDEDVFSYCGYIIGTMADELRDILLMKKSTFPLFKKYTEVEAEIEFHTYAYVSNLKDKEDKMVINASLINIQYFHDVIMKHAGTDENFDAWWESKDGMMYRMQMINTLDTFLNDVYLKEEDVNGKAEFAYRMYDEWINMWNNASDEMNHGYLLSAIIHAKTFLDLVNLFQEKGILDYYDEYLNQCVEKAKKFIKKYETN